MDVNSYFHIGSPDKPIHLQAKETEVDLNRQYSRRNNVNLGWLGTMYGGEYNPDKLNYRIYDKMMLNPQIRSCITFIDYARLSKKWIITPASDDPYDIEVATFTRKVIENLRTPFRLVRKNMYTSLRYGYSVGEINFATRVMNGETRIVWDTIQPLHINTLPDCFEYNDDNTVKTVWQRPLGGYSGEPIQIPGNKCIINSFDEIFGNKYGNSGLRSVYDNYFMINKIMKWYANYLYKLEGPAILGKSENKDQMLQVLDEIKEGTMNGVVDLEDQVEILESKHRGEGYLTAINHHNHQIAINFMIGSLLLGQAENQGGSYSLGQTHLDVAKIYLDGLHEDDSIPIQERIKNLVDLNYSVDSYPKFSFEKFTQKDLIALLQAIQPYAASFVLTADELGLGQLIPAILEQYADIEIEHNNISPSKTPPSNPNNPPEIEEELPVVNMKAGRPAANYVQMNQERVKRGGMLY